MHYFLFFLYYILILIIFLFFLPIIILAILVILIVDNHNPFYFERRSGIYGKPFVIFKLRTMKSTNNNKFVTKLGVFLRLFKIDELSQIFNVLLGHMSFVGPRPLYLEYNKKYSAFELNRLNVKPGITGLAQIKVTNNNNWKAKFKYDVFYANNKSINFDFYILCKTFSLYYNILLGKKLIREDHNRFDD